MNGDPKKEERNIVAINNQTCNPTCEEYIRIDLLGPMSRTIFLNLIQSVSLSIQSVSLSLWIESTLFVIQLILTQFFQPTLYKLIVLVLWASIHLSWAESQIWSLQVTSAFASLSYPLLLQPFFLHFLFISPLPSTLISFFLFPFIFLYFFLFLFTLSYCKFVTIFSILCIVFLHKKCFFSLSPSNFWWIFFLFFSYLCFRLIFFIFFKTLF